MMLNQFSTGFAHKAHRKPGGQRNERRRELWDQACLPALLARPVCRNMLGTIVGYILDSMEGCAKELSWGTCPTKTRQENSGGKIHKNQAAQKYEAVHNPFCLNPALRTGFGEATLSHDFCLSAHSLPGPPPPVLAREGPTIGFANSLGLDLHVAPLHTIYSYACPSLPLMFMTLPSFGQIFEKVLQTKLPQLLRIPVSRQGRKKHTPWNPPLFQGLRPLCCVPFRTCGV